MPSRAIKTTYRKKAYEEGLRKEVAILIGSVQFADVDNLTLHVYLECKNAQVRKNTNPSQPSPEVTCSFFLLSRWEFLLFSLAQ